MNNNKQCKAMIIGAGSIGALKDDKYDKPSDRENILTHAHAFYNNHNINLSLIVDINIEEATRAAKKWGVPNVKKSVDDIKPGTYDIVAVCTPTKTHYEMLKKVARLKPSIVIAEKPFCVNISEACEIRKLYEKYNIELVVDYIRRFDPTLRNIRNKLRIGEFGNIYAAKVMYNRGLEHEGCHAIDLFLYFFGKFCCGEIINQNDFIIDNFVYDPTYAVAMKFQYCPHVIMIPVDGRKYSVFEIEIITESGIIKFIEHGKWIEIVKTMPEPTYGDYKTLDYNNTQLIPTNLIRSLCHLTNECVDYLDGSISDISSGVDNAISVKKILKHLKLGLRK